MTPKAFHNPISLAPNIIFLLGNLKRRIFTRLVHKRQEINSNGSLPMMMGLVSITLTYIFIFIFQIPRRKIHHSDSCFPAEYEYVNSFFSSTSKFPKVLFQRFTNHLRQPFLINVNAEEKKFNAMYAYNSSNGTNLTPIHNFELYNVHLGNFFRKPY